MGQLTEGLDGALPQEVLTQMAPEEHRANLYCAINNQPGGVSKENLDYMLNRKQGKRVHP